MTKLRLPLLALLTGLLVGGRARRRAVARAAGGPAPDEPFGLRRDLATLETRLATTLAAQERAQRRRTAVGFALAVVTAVPVVVVLLRPDLPEAVVAGVLGAELLAAAVALAVAARL